MYQDGTDAVNAVLGCREASRSDTFGIVETSCLQRAFDEWPTLVDLVSAPVQETCTKCSAPIGPSPFLLCSKCLDESYGKR